MSLLSDQSKNFGSKETSSSGSTVRRRIPLRGKEALRQHKHKLFNMSESSMSGLSKLNLKKKIQMLSKKTHFTEKEVGKLLDCHFQIMVGIILSLDTCINIV